MGTKSHLRMIFVSMNLMFYEIYATSINLLEFWNMMQGFDHNDYGTICIDQTT